MIIVLTTRLWEHRCTRTTGPHLLPIDVLDGEVVETRWGGGADREQPQVWPGNHEEVLDRLANKVDNINMRMTIAWTFHQHEDIQMYPTRAQWRTRWQRQPNLHKAPEQHEKPAWLDLCSEALQCLIVGYYLSPTDYKSLIIDNWLWVAREASMAGPLLCCSVSWILRLIIISIVLDYRLLTTVYWLWAAQELNMAGPLGLCSYLLSRTKSEKW